jgi:hypothetical protein
MTAFYARINSRDGSYNTNDAIGLYIANMVKGVGHTVTNQFGIYIQPLTGATTNWAIYTNNPVRFGGTTVVEGRITSFYGVNGVTDNEHFTFGKLASPAAGNPYYTWKTDPRSSSVASLSGWDGTTSRTFIKADFNQSKIILGDTGGGVTVEFASPIFSPGVNFGSVHGKLEFTDLTPTATDARFKFRNSTSNHASLRIIAQETAVILDSVQSIDSSVNKHLRIQPNGGQVTIESPLGIGQLTGSYVGLYMSRILFGSTAHYGVFSSMTYDVDATTAMIAMYSRVNSSAGSYTTGNVYGLFVDTVNKGSGHTITNQYGIFINNQNLGSSNYALYTNLGLVRFGDTVFATNGLDVSGARIVQNSGTDAATDNEHFSFGKVGSGTSGNPYYTLKTNANSVPEGSLSSWDGSLSRVYMRMNHENALLYLPLKIVAGDAAAFGDISGQCLISHASSSVSGSISTAHISMVHNGATSGFVTSLGANTRLSHTSGTTNAAFGASFICEQNGAGNVTRMGAMQTVIGVGSGSSGGTITEATHIYCGNAYDNGTALILTNIGLHIAQQTRGNSNNWGVEVDAAFRTDWGSGTNDSRVWIWDVSAGVLKRIRIANANTFGVTGKDGVGRGLFVDN